ncbi:uncharacterized protein [Apostichopus japonicus]|uniref:uncharacterized protein isoform X2 n=1 Tax=Stichopus japonicus TaxID=307972 RepID=UPI003AB78161
MASATLRRQVRQDTTHVLFLLLQDDQVPFTIVQSGGGKVTSKGQEYEDIPHDELPEVEVAERNEETGGYETITKTVTKEEMPDLYQIYARERAIHKVAERIKELGDNLNKEIQPELQQILVQKMLLEAGEVTYATFEEWIKEILDKHQHSLTDKSDRHQVALLLMGVKLAFRTAKGQIQLTNTICDRLRDYMVDFVSKTFPNWIYQQG